jgi:hypothetical protein
METGFTVTAAGNVELEPRLGDQVVKFDEICRKELQTAMGQMDVNHPAGTYGHGPEIFFAGQYGLIVHVVVLPQVSRSLYVPGHFFAIGLGE